MRGDHLFTTVPVAVPGLGSVDAGRERINRAGAELSTLRILAAHYQAGRPLAEARIAVVCPLTSHFAVLIETLARLGARIRCAGTERVDDDVVAALQASDIPVFARDGQSRRERLENLHRALDWEHAGGADLILDTDADLARLIHAGVAAEAGNLPPAIDDDKVALHRAIWRQLATRQAFYSAVATNIAGLSECTAHGVDRLRRIEQSEGLMFPAIDASNSGLAGYAPDRSRVATDSLAGLLARQAFAQIALFSRGSAYRPGLHRLPAGLKQILADHDADAVTANLVADNSVDRRRTTSPDVAPAPHRA